MKGYRIIMAGDKLEGINEKTAVIIVNWNNHEDTVRCIESLKAQVFRLVIIVVDNGSEREDVKRLEDIDGIKLIKNRENVGFGRANNVGIAWVLRNTDCSNLLLLNNDTVIKDDTIGILTAALMEDPHSGIAAPRIVLLENPGRLWYGGGEVSWIRGGAVVHGYMDNASAPDVLIGKYVTFASGCAMMIRREVFEKIGGFDPRYFMYEEDLELCLRTLEAGWRIRYVPDSVVLHRGQGATRKEAGKFVPLWSPHNPKLAFYMFHITKNRLLNMYSHARGVRSLLFSLMFPILLAKKAAQFLVHARFDGIASIASAIKIYYHQRKGSFVNELNGQSGEH